jgi:hypothetical protein
MSKVLSREAILASNDIKSEMVDCPEWGGSVMVQALTLAEVDQWRKSMLTKTVTKDHGKTSVDYSFDAEKAVLSEIKLVCMAVVDESRNRLFTDKDVEALMKKSPIPLKRIIKAVSKLSGLNTDEEIEDALKNSEPDPTESSTTD